MKSNLRGFTLMLLVFVSVVSFMPFTAPVFHWLFPDLLRPLYTRASFVELTLAHCTLVALATAIAAAIGIGLGIFVTRDSGRDFLSMVGTLAAIGQTFPPVAVLALAIPLLGYGAAPTLLALILYSTLPILEATIAGLYSVPAAAQDAAKGLGFSPLSALWQIELPLAAPFIFAGLRNAAIINIGTATIGSSVGALSLGSPILEGLSASNPAYVMEGALIVSFLAVVVDNGFKTLEHVLLRR
jgi:osmoprotectant transport system permease protein